MHTTSHNSDRNNTKIYSAKLFAITLTPGHPTTDLALNFAKSIAEAEIDYVIFRGPGRAMISDSNKCLDQSLPWDFLSHDATPIYEAVVERNLPTFWITDSLLPPGHYPQQYERGVKFDESPNRKILLGASELVFPEVINDIHLYHGEDPNTAFQKIVVKYGSYNPETRDLANLRLKTIQRSSFLNKT
jgi:hypothetical protein